MDNSIDRKYFDPNIMEGVSLQLSQIIKSWHKTNTTEIADCPAFVVNGNLFCFFVTNGIVLTSYNEKMKNQLQREFTITSFELDEENGSQNTEDEWIKIDISDKHFTSVIPFIERSYRLTLLGDDAE